MKISVTHLSVLICLLTLISCEPLKEDSLGHWPVYRGDKAALQYSPLDQINTENVGQLEVAWTYQTMK